MRNFFFLLFHFAYFVIYFFRMKRKKEIVQTANMLQSKSQCLNELTFKCFVYFFLFRNKIKNNRMQNRKSIFNDEQKKYQLTVSLKIRNIFSSFCFILFSEIKKIQINLHKMFTLESIKVDLVFVVFKVLLLLYFGSSTKEEEKKIHRNTAKCDQWAGIKIYNLRIQPKVTTINLNTKSRQKALFSLSLIFWMLMSSNCDSFFFLFSDRVTFRPVIRFKE